jgi:hypothetical protein
LADYLEGAKGKSLVTADHLAQLKAEGYLTATEIAEMDEFDLLCEVEEFGRYIDRKNEAQKRESP